MVPCVELNKPARIFESVDFPAPFLPVIDSDAGEDRENEISLKTALRLKSFDSPFTIMEIGLIGSLPLSIYSRCSRFLQE